MRELASWALCFGAVLAGVLCGVQPASQLKQTTKTEAFFQHGCSASSVCDQLCVDVVQYGGHVCGCEVGYFLQADGFTCAEKTASPSTVSPALQRVDDDEEMGGGRRAEEEEGEMGGGRHEEESESEEVDESSGSNEDLEMSLQHIAGRDDSLSADVSKRARRRHKGQRRRGGRRRHKGRWPYDPYLSDAPAGSGVKHKSCKELQCHAGGRCVRAVLGGGVRCQCLLGTTGDFCERDVVVRYPQFSGASFLAFAPPRGASEHLHVSVELRPDALNGLVLFGGEFSDARLDFFSLSLVDGRAQFRFDCGSGLVTLTSKQAMRLGEWNTVVLHRRASKGWLQLNGASMVKARSPGPFTRITFRQDLYLGGYRNNSLIAPRTGSKWGFVGCVRSLTLNNRRYDMRKGTFVGDALRGLDVGECSAHLCESTRCQNGGTCVADSADTSVCLCPLGTAGDKCETKIDIHVAAFEGNSYLQLIGLRRSVLSFMDGEVVFKPTAEDGLILYNGYTTDRSGDFISLSLVAGYLEFCFDLGSGPAIIRSRDKVSLHKWHMARFSRNGRDGLLQLDSHEAVQGMSKGAYTQLTLTLDLFIGGHRNFDEVARSAGIDKSFKGCIQKVVINERTLRLLDEALTGVNVDNCNHPCVGQPCLNGGRCVPLRDNYKCNCPLGFENTNCEDKLQHEIEVPRFSGNGYLKYVNPEILLRVRGSASDITLKIRTRSGSGLLLWAGEEEMSVTSDFLAVSLTAGRATLSFNLGSGPTTLVLNGTRLDDNQWHRVHVSRTEKTAYIQVDNMEMVETVSPGRLTQLNTGKALYLGGLADIEHRSLKRFHLGFEGCVSELTVGADYRVALTAEAVDGENVQPCS